MSRNIVEKTLFHARHKLPFLSPQFKGVAEITELRGGSPDVKKKDYFRRVLPEEDEPGKEKYEFFYQDATTAPISYDYLEKRDDGTDVLRAWTPDYNVFVPYRIDYDDINPDSEEGDVLGISGDPKLWVKAASSELNRQANTIWKDDDKGFLREHPELIVYLGAGAFFLLYGYGLKMAFSDATSALQEAANQFAGAASILAMRLKR